MCIYIYSICKNSVNDAEKCSEDEIKLSECRRSGLLHIVPFAVT